MLEDETLPSDKAQSGATDRSELTRSELSSRASRSVLVVTLWGFTGLGLGFIGNVVLARLLEPADFGVFAIGSVVLLVAYGISEAGLGPGMIRRPEPPTRSELRSLNGFQVAVTSIMAVAIAGVAIPLGRTGDVVAIMVAAMPIAVLQTPGRILFARQLAYERLALVEAASVIVFYVWSIATVSLGWGVWGLATGAIARAMAGTASIWLVSELGVVGLARGRWEELRPIVWFGMRIQATWLVIMVRDLVLSGVTIALGGIASLGLWSLCRRLIEVPLVLFDSLWRVTFPAMSHILAADEDPAPLLERGARVFAVISSVSLTVFAGVFPAIIPMLFGEDWHTVANILPWATVGLLIAGTISVATVGYLQAAGHPEDTLVAAVWFSLVWIATSAALLPVVGVEAVGVGWITGGAVEAFLLGRSTQRRSGARVLRAAGTILVVGVVGCAVAGILSVTLATGVQSAVVATAAGVAVVLAGMATVALSTLIEAVRTIRAAVARAFSRAVLDE